MFKQEDNAKLGEPIKKNEDMVVIHASAKEKIPSLDGWGVELFHHFFDLMIENILVVEEESHINGYIT